MALSAAPILGQPPYGDSDACAVGEPASLQACAEACRACPLWEHATQVVFGEGPRDARLVMIGEQPGDQEDLAGHPFVGPSGRVLDECLAEAGIDRTQVYVTNAVKHFKWVPSHGRRLHQKPNRSEMMACKPWLDAEIEMIRPKFIVCLGATAAQSLLGPKFRLTQHFGEILASPYGPEMVATLHPSAVLRAPDPSMREENRLRMIADLRIAAGYLTQHRLAA